jgi:hypothetical protein
VIFIARAIIKRSKKYDVNYVEPTIRPGYEDSPGGYKIHISPARAWELTSQFKGAKAFMGIGWALLIVLGGYLACVGLGLFETRGNGIAIGYFIICVAACACMFGAYSSLFANNEKTVTTIVYERIKNDASALGELFSNPIR